MKTVGVTIRQDRMDAVAPAFSNMEGIQVATAPPGQGDELIYWYDRASMAAYLAGETRFPLCQSCGLELMEDHRCIPYGGGGDRGMVEEN